MSLFAPWRVDPLHESPDAPPSEDCETVISFDVEEHHRIEAAADLSIPPALQSYYAARLAPATEWLLDQLDEFGIRATFFVVGQIAASQPRLVRKIAERGHEVGSHSWDHRRIHRHTPASYREDLRLSRDAIEQATGQAVLGYRAPTFSVVAENAWAVDELAEAGFAYDSSIFPVHHDRYGVPRAPRAPFRVEGFHHDILELPIATLRVWGVNLPVGGGGYFRLFPLALLRRALKQIGSTCSPNVAMLYFHPWEFDPDQQRLPLGRWSAFRTYVGIGRTRDRLRQVLAGRRCARAIDVAQRLKHNEYALPSFSLTGKELPRMVAEPAMAGVP